MREEKKEKKGKNGQMIKLEDERGKVEVS